MMMEAFMPFATHVRRPSAGGWLARKIVPSKVRCGPRCILTAHAPAPCGPIPVEALDWQATCKPLRRLLLDVSAEPASRPYLRPVVAPCRPPNCPRLPARRPSLRGRRSENFPKDWEEPLCPFAEKFRPCVRVQFFPEN